jgi:hypothetical protein
MYAQYHVWAAQQRQHHRSVIPETQLVNRVIETPSIRVHATSPDSSLVHMHPPSFSPTVPLQSDPHYRQPNVLNTQLAKVVTNTSQEPVVPVSPVTIPIQFKPLSLAQVEVSQPELDDSWVIIA